MIRWRDGIVTERGTGWPGAMELRVRLSGPGADDAEPVKALAYTALVGEPEVGDRVLLNATALLMGLGTGGHAVGGAAPPAATRWSWRSPTGCRPIRHPRRDISSRPATRPRRPRSSASTSRTRTRTKRSGTPTT